MASIKLPIKDSQTARVNLTNFGMSEVFKTTNSLNADYLKNPNDVVQVAEFAKDKISEVNSMPSFESIKELEGLYYVGYIIEKQRLNKTTGAWQTIDEYRIIGKNAEKLIDTRIAYNHVYRYRIKTVARLTKKIENKKEVNASLTKDITQAEVDRIQKSLGDKKEILSNLDKLTTFGITPKTSSGNTSLRVNIIENLSLIADAERITIEETTARSLRTDLFNGNIDSSTRSLSGGKVTREELDRRINQNLEKFYIINTEYRSFYFESDPSKNWEYLPVAEVEPPPPPSNFYIVPDSKNEIIKIFWSIPALNQRDIKSVRVYKRNAVGEEWIKIADQLSRNNYFLDNNVDFQGNYIYTLTSVDYHGVESLLSTQVQISLNPKFRDEKKENKLKLVSYSGVKKEEINRIITPFREEQTNIVANNNIRIKPNKNSSFEDRDFIVKITSLDTREIKEVKLKIKNIKTK